MSKTVIKYDCTCHFSIETRCTVSKLSFLILKISILKMKVTESEHIRKRVYSMLASRPKADVVKHFLNEGIPRSTIYSVIRRFEANLTFERKPKSGRPSNHSTELPCENWRKLLVTRLVFHKINWHVNSRCLNQQFVQMWPKWVWNIVNESNHPNIPRNSSTKIWKSAKTSRRFKRANENAGYW